MKKYSTITTKSLNVWYNGFQALKNVNISIQRNSITALIGPSGSGKSTFLRSLNRIIELIPNSRVEGEIVFNNTNILNGTTDIIELRRKVGMVFQNPTPFPKSIFDNVAYGLEIQGLAKRSTGGLFGFLQGKTHHKDIEKSDNSVDQKVVESLREANLWEEVKERLFQSAYKLSGGQQQRLCIARAIAIRPEVLLLDEPCSELDPISTRKIEELLIILKNHYTIIIVTHNMYQAKRISDYTGFFHLGELVEFDTTKKIFQKASQKLTRNYVAGSFG